MNETETQPPALNPDMEWQIAALQRQVFMLLLALIVVASTVVFYLFYQSRILSYDLNQSRTRDMQVINFYNQNARIIAGIESELGNYAMTHPNFQPVLKKYGWSPTATPTK
jgi:uncharacterized protein YpmS